MTVRRALTGRAGRVGPEGALPNSTNVGGRSSASPLGQTVFEESALTAENRLPAPVSVSLLVRSRGGHSVKLRGGATSEYHSGLLRNAEPARDAGPTACGISRHVLPAGPGKQTGPCDSGMLGLQGTGMTLPHPTPADLWRREGSEGRAGG